jgi:NADP-dependent 3-hydroxy acid dehydrogenase YdfG
LLHPSVLPVFLKQGLGHIINVISTGGLKIVPLQGVYAATKNAVRTLTEALRQEARSTPFAPTKPPLLPRAAAACGQIGSHQTRRRDG